MTLLSKNTWSFRARALVLVFLPVALLQGPELEAAPQQAGAKPEVNERFQNPDVESFVERFEKEGREVFDKRHQIVDACGIEPGDSVADVGAGTGLFTRLFSRAAGPSGTVFAVDISKAFIDHIESTASAEGLSNIRGIVCEQTDTGLPPLSVDLVFLSDTYHHFESPRETMASVHRALRPGGKLIVIDFERRQGTSSDWILDHVRAGKDEVIKEIESFGFQLVDDKHLLDENYFLTFTKDRPHDR